MEKTVRIIKEYKINIPDEDIPELLEGYREVIERNGNEESLFKQIAWSIGQNDDYFVEGIGIVLREGSVPYEYQDKKYITRINTKENGIDMEIEEVD